MDELIQSILALLKSIVESPEFRALIIGLITLGIGWLGTKRVRQTIKTDAEKQRATQVAALESQYADQVKRIELKQQELLNSTLEQYQQLFQQERSKFELKTKEFEALERKYDEQGMQVTKLERRVGELEAGLNQYKLTVADKDRIIKELTDNQCDMTRRLEALETERDGLAKLAQQREDELVKRDSTIAQQQQEITTLNGKVEELQKRLDAIEKKSDTGELDPAKLPSPSPAPTPPAEGASDSS